MSTVGAGAAAGVMVIVAAVSSTPAYRITVTPTTSSQRPITHTDTSSAGLTKSHLVTINEYSLPPSSVHQPPSLSIESSLTQVNIDSNLLEVGYSSDHTNFQDSKTKGHNDGPTKVVGESKLIGRRAVRTYFGDMKVTDESQISQLKEVRKKFFEAKKEELIKKHKLSENIWLSPEPELNRFAVTNDWFNWGGEGLSQTFTEEEKKHVISEVKNHWCSNKSGIDYPKLATAISPSRHWWHYTYRLEYYLWWQSYCDGLNSNHPDWYAETSRWPGFSLWQKHQFWKRRSSY